MNILNDLRDRAYNTAKAKGWYDGEPVTYQERIALVHSEISEMIEGYRSGQEPSESVYGEDGKPLGIDSEVIDVLIRILDLSGYYNIDLDDTINKSYWLKNKSINTLNEFRDEMINQWELKDTKIPFGKFINILHIDVCKCNLDDYHLDGNDSRLPPYIAKAIGTLFKFCGYFKIDMDKAMKEKMDYNDRRSYRHGQKRL